MTKKSTTDNLLTVYHLLLDKYGPQHWWPALTAFEVIVGAILTQSASWTNVEKAVANLEAAGVLSVRAMRHIPESKLAELIHSSGYYNAKAHKLKAFVDWLAERHHEDLDELFGLDVARLRQQLLSVHGIGEETADSIILYAANRPVFVIDAYTRRIATRLGLKPRQERYSDYQVLFMGHLPADTGMFNEYHALLVRLGKEACLKHNPRCAACCLQRLCAHGRNASARKYSLTAFRTIRYNELKASGG